VFIQFDPHPWINPPLQPGVLGSLNAQLCPHIIDPNKPVRILGQYNNPNDPTINVGIRSKVVRGNISQGDERLDDSNALALFWDNGRSEVFEDGVIYPLQIPPQGVRIAPTRSSVNLVIIATGPVFVQPTEALFHISEPVDLKHAGHQSVLPVERP